MKLLHKVSVVACCLAAFPAVVSADPPSFLFPSGAASGCGLLPSQAALGQALASAVATETSGLDFQMWATLVDRDGVVCAVAFSGAAGFCGTSLVSLSTWP